LKTSHWKICLQLDETTGVSNSSQLIALGMCDHDDARKKTFLPFTCSCFQDFAKLH